MTGQYIAGRKGLRVLVVINPSNIHWLNNKKMKTFRDNSDVDKIANKDLNTIEIIKTVIQLALLTRCFVFIDSTRASILVQVLNL